MFKGCRKTSSICSRSATWGYTGTADTNTMKKWVEKHVSVHEKHPFPELYEAFNENKAAYKNRNVDVTRIWVLHGIQGSPKFHLK